MHNENYQEVLFLKRRSTNIKKLTKSAKEGNQISKKLLTIICNKPDNVVESLNEIEKTIIKKNSIA